MVELCQPVVFPPQLWRRSASVPGEYEFPQGLCRHALAKWNAAVCILPSHRSLQSATSFSTPESLDGLGFTSCRRASAGVPARPVSLLHFLARQSGHRIFVTLLKLRIYHRFRASQFSGMILICYFGCVRLTDASVTSESLVERKGSHHFHPEPCAGHREVSGEASVGACAGRAIEPRNAVYRMCRDCPNDRRQHFTAALG